MQTENKALSLGHQRLVVRGPEAMSAEYVNLVKLCVGATTVSELYYSQQRRLETTGFVSHVTRMWPKRAKELVSGGSIYWVFRGLILARQEIVEMKEILGQDKIRRCSLILNHEIFRTEPRPKKPFQGWRYLTPEHAPKDICKFQSEETEIPYHMQLELSKLGVL